MSYSYNKRKKEIKKAKKDKRRVLSLFGGTWRYQFDGRKWRLIKHRSYI